eukprot:379819-Rhodomonas_salina.1
MDLSSAAASLSASELRSDSPANGLNSTFRSLSPPPPPPPPPPLPSRRRDPRGVGWACGGSSWLAGPALVELAGPAL